MCSKIIDPCISRRWFLRTCTGYSKWTIIPAVVVVVDSVVVWHFRYLYTPCFDGYCVFWRLEKNSLFYDPVISRPQLFGQDFVVNFATYTQVHTVRVYAARCATGCLPVIKQLTKCCLRPDEFKLSKIAGDWYCWRSEGARYGDGHAHTGNEIWK